MKISGYPAPLTLARLRRVVRALLAAPARTSAPPLELAEIELWRVHRIEQAELLLEAARIGRMSATPERTRRLAHWRRECAFELTTARADDYPLSPRLVDCATNPCARWPPGSALVRAARRRGARAT